MFRFDPNKYSTDKLDVVTHTDGPMLVLAVAGSGKTYAITHRIAYLIDCCGISPRNIVAVSFTRKAAKELSKRVALLVGKEKAHQCQLSTFHALGHEILRDHIELLGWKKPFAIFDNDDQKKIIKDICKNSRFVGAGFDPENLLHLISITKNRGGDPQKTFPRWHPKFNAFVKIYHDYQSTRKSMNGVDFDDLIQLPGDLFEQYPDILSEYENQWQYIMIDEYQDTNALQFRMVQQLCRHQANIMVVGDDDQAIYGFRGADSNHILNFPNMFENVKVVKLEFNFRSTRHILDAANSVIEKNTKRYPKFLKTEGEDGAMLRGFSVPTPEEEGMFVAEQIELEHATKNLRYDDFAVLYRANSQSEAIEKGLVARQIPYRIVGGTKFFDHAEIRDLVFYLRSALSLDDELALRRIVNVPRRGITSASLEMIDSASRAQNLSFFETLKQFSTSDDLTTAPRMKLAKFVETLETYHVRFAQKTEPMYKTMRDLIESLHFREYIASSSANDTQTSIRLENIHEFLNDLALFENTQGRDLMGYLHKIVMDAPRGESDDDKDCVTLMTLHSSKGLEFKSVYMVGCEENIIPHVNALESKDPTAIDEERRLFYVGMTRAKKYLTLTRCEKRRKLNESYDSPASRYLNDISEDDIVLAQSRSEFAKENEKIAQKQAQTSMAAIRAMLFGGSK